MMTDIQPFTLIGATPSPYTRKMVSLLRYRRIPYRIIWNDPGVELKKRGIALPKIPLLPTCLMNNTDGDPIAVCDSTPIIRQLESKFVERSVIPTDPVIAFFDYLLEDFADEWCTKYMFHYRWSPPQDADNAGTLLPFCSKVDLADDTFQHFKVFVTDRQINRLKYVGSNEITAPLIDESYRRFLSALEASLTRQPFVLGQRPSACDFAIFGQLTQLVGFDPTSRRIAHEIAPRVVAWTSVMEDQCGLDVSPDDWNNAEQLHENIAELLHEVGRVYVPALLANTEGLKAGNKQWEATIDGRLWSQQTFPYQAKCLTWINEEYQALSNRDRSRVDTILQSTGCEALLR